MYTFVQISIAAMNLILQQQKRKHVKIPVDIAKEGMFCTVLPEACNTFFQRYTTLIIGVLRFHTMFTCSGVTVFINEVRKLPEALRLLFARLPKLSPFLFTYLQKSLCH